MNKRKSIKKRLIIIITALVSLAVFMTAALSLNNTHRSERKRFIEKIHLLARILGENATAAIEFNNSDDANAVLNTLHEMHSVDKAAFYIDNKLFASYLKNDSMSKFAENHLFPQEETIYLQDNIQVTLQLGIASEQEVNIIIIGNLTELHQAFNENIKVTLIITLLVIALSFLIAIWVQHRVTDPISLLSKLAIDISENKDYTQRAQLIENDEIGDLTKSFNEMLYEISKRDLEVVHERNLAE
ncbi:MAG: HAMP domain-containing protein, partial [Lentisphaeraceae bacterium]|nr:HAMP domain-containing protein [Lentisphaeraceae bacterium]